MNWERRNRPRYGPDTGPPPGSGKLRRRLQARGLAVTLLADGLEVAGARRGVHLSGTLRPTRWHLTFRHPDLQQRPADRHSLPPHLTRLLQSCSVVQGELTWSGSAGSERRLDELELLAWTLTLADDHPTRRDRLERAARQDGGDALRHLLAADLAAGWAALGAATATLRTDRPTPTVELRPDLPEGLAFGPELGRLQTLWQGADVAIGDPDFDDAVRIGGSERWWRAALDRTHRAQVAAWARRGARLQDGVLTWSCPAPDLADLPDLIDLLARLSNHDEDRLARHVRDEAEPLDVRAGAARVLLLDRPELLDTLPADVLVALLDHAGHRLAAVRALGERGPAEATTAIVAVTTGLFVGAELRDAGRRAVAAIEARAGIQRGQLAVAASHGGALSPPEEA